MAITVLFFGQLAEITGTGELKIDETDGTQEFPGMTEISGAKLSEISRANLAEITGTKLITGTKELKELLISRYPGLAEIVFNIAVDTVIIEEDTRLKPGSIVALLPPFSGG
jgi:molybdopterin converting factor small subunit